MSTSSHLSILFFFKYATEWSIKINAQSFETSCTKEQNLSKENNAKGEQVYFDNIQKLARIFSFGIF